MTKDFNYHLTGTGWAEAFFAKENQNIRIDISYLSDPLSELFEGLIRLMNNVSDTEIILFAEEPGEHTLIISKLDKDTIRIEIYWNDEWEEMNNSHKTQNRKELVYTDTDTLNNFTKNICVGIDSLLGRMTLEEYKERWSLFEFPIKTYDSLRKLLN